MANGQAGTTPLNYLILIGRIDVLPRLFGKLLVPPAVIHEMQHPKTPPSVAEWASNLPAWIEIKAPHTDLHLGVGAGEDEAIALAVELGDAAILMDDKKARAIAETRSDFGPNWLGITWSLAVEEQFYLFVPFLIYFLPRRALVCVMTLFVLAAPLLRWASPGFHAYVGTPWRSDSLLLGALLAVFVRLHPFVFTVRRHRSFILALFGALLLGAAVMTLKPSLFGAFDHLWLAILYSTFILIAFIGDEALLGRMLESRALVWFGRLSYGIYIFHQAVSGTLHGLLRQNAPQIRTVSDAGITLLALCITLSLAALSYRFFETPLLRLGHRTQYLPKPQRDSTFQAVPNGG